MSRSFVVQTLPQRLVWRQAAAVAMAITSGTLAPRLAAAQNAQAAPAQTAAPAATPQTPAAPAAPSPSPVSVGLQNGLNIQTADGDYRLQVGTVVQFDGRFSTNDPTPITNTFLIRKARLGISGRVARYFDYRLVPEFAGNTPTLLDAYFDIRFSPAFRVRTGKDKTPLGYELLQSDPALLFPERSFVSSLIPNRDSGVQVQGDLSGGKVTYAGGIFNGVPDGISSVGDLDTNNGKDFAGRLLVTPFRNAARPNAFLNNFGFNIGASSGDQTGALPSFRTSSGQVYFSYAAAPNATTASGTRTRVSPAVFLYYKSLGTFFEYARTTQDVARLGETTEVTNQAWGVNAAWYVTGETASYGVPGPRRPFDPQAGRWGALQIAARYAVLDVDDIVFERGLAAAGSSSKASQFTVGVNWYPIGPVKYYATYERTVFDGESDGPRPAEDLILFRAQFAF